jgi:hypothetical protein
MRLGGLASVLVAVSLLAPVLGLGGCASRGGEAPAAGALRAFSSDSFVSCVPFARSVTGIDIRGDAWTWWDQAAGRYARGQVPIPGAVLAFAGTHQLPLGHLSVVEQVVSPREILVEHANWSSTPAWRGKVLTGQRIVDVSPANDWTAVRVQNHLGSLGGAYVAHGFIYQQRVAAAR